MKAKPKPPRSITTLADLTPDPANARRHTPRNVGQIEAALNEVGAARSIVIDEAGLVLAGNATIDAAARAGITRVQVVDADGETIVAVRRTGLTPAQKTRLALYDNRAAELAEWDEGVLAAIQREEPELLAGLFADDELAEILAGLEPEPVADDPGAQVNQAEELRQAWGVGLGQMWALGEHRLVCGDCTDAAVVARVMGGEKADCVFTSPPYAVGVDYGEYKDTIANLRAMLPPLAALWLEAVKPGGYAVVNFGDVASGRHIAETDEPCEYPMAVEYWPVFRAVGWLLWSRRIWCKPNPRVHSPWCIQSNRAATDWEHIWTWRKPGVPIIKRVDGAQRSALGWYQSSQAHGVDIGKDTHGAGMALGIAEWMLNVHSRPGEPVLEPFSGSGTTLIACERLARRCCAIEINPGYVAVTIERWATMTGRVPERVEA